MGIADGHGEYFDLRNAQKQERSDPDPDPVAGSEEQDEEQDETYYVRPAEGLIVVEAPQHYDTDAQYDLALDLAAQLEDQSVPLGILVLPKGARLAGRIGILSGLKANVEAIDDDSDDDEDDDAPEM